MDEIGLLQIGHLSTRTQQYEHKHACLQGRMALEMMASKQTLHSPNELYKSFASFTIPLLFIT